METFVEITRKPRLSEEERKALISPEVDLNHALAHIDSELVCRTCVNRANKTWMYPRTEVIGMLTEGVTMEDLACTPTKPLVDYRVVRTTDRRFQIVPLAQNSPFPTQAKVTGCGQTLRPECKSCDRFESVTVAIPYNRDGEKISYRLVGEGSNLRAEPYAANGGYVSYWRTTVGGHCTLPVEGIVRNGERLYCDPKPRKRKVESPSCGNCFYLYRPTEQWQFDHLEVNRNAALTPFEREQAIENKPEEQTDAQAIGIALYRKQTMDYSRRIPYPAWILSKLADGDMIKYTVRFKDNGVAAILAEGDPRWEITDPGIDVGWSDLQNPILTVIYVKWPDNRLLRLGDNLRKETYRWPAMPKAERRFNRDPIDLIDPSCGSCRATRPCYYHSKAPYRSDVTGEIVFENPDGLITQEVLPKHALLYVKEVRGRIRVVDGNDNEPVAYSETTANASVFRARLKGLLEQAQQKWGFEGEMAVREQYIRVISLLHRTGKYISVRPAWLATSGQEPSKPTCSHPKGLDLRSVFQDSFGSERADWNFDHGWMTRMQVEEEIRAGTRQHQLTPQKLQEEILATLHMNPNFDPATGSVVESGFSMPEDSFVTEIKAIGGATHTDGSPVTDTSEFLDLLDEEVVVGFAGESPRTMSKRMQLFGYAMSRGYFGSRKGNDKLSVPALDSEVVIFGDLDDDQRDKNEDWRCSVCDKTYTQDALDDPFWPVCECGNDLYRSHRTSSTFNPRSKGGVGTAIVADTASMQSDRRLYETVCPSWRLNSSALITLADVSGPDERESERVGETKAAKAQPEIFQVGGELTEEMKAANRKYEDELMQVTQSREQHLAKFPDTPTAELHTLFPTPVGVVYRQKAVGSAAKMG